MAMMANRTQQYRLLQRVLGLAVASFVVSGLSAPAAGQTAWKWPTSGHVASNATAAIPWDAVSKPAKAPSGASSTEAVESESEGAVAREETAWSELAQGTSSPTATKSKKNKTAQSNRDAQPISLQAATRQSTGSTRPTPKSMTSLLSERRPSGLKNHPVPIQTNSISGSANLSNATPPTIAQDQSGHDDRHRSDGNIAPAASLMIDAGNESTALAPKSPGSTEVLVSPSVVEQRANQLRITDTEPPLSSPIQPAVVEAVKPLDGLPEASTLRETMVGKPVGTTATQRVPAGAMKIYETSAMTGPLTDPEKLFARLKVEDDFRKVPIATGLANQRAEPTGLHWGPTDKVWVSPTFQHQPLYFEQPNLERYGIGGHRVLQPCIRQRTSLDP